MCVTEDTTSVGKNLFELKMCSHVSLNREEGCLQNAMLSFRHEYCAIAHLKSPPPN